MSKKYHGPSVLLNFAAIVNFFVRTFSSFGYTRDSELAHKLIDVSILLKSVKLSRRAFFDCEKCIP